MVYEDKNVDIYFTGLTEKGISFSVKNKTDISLTVQADSLSINGENIDNILMSDNIAPQSTGTVIAKCDVSSYEEVRTIGGQLRIVDLGSLKSVCKAKFVNVDVTE